jgi:TonB family protein
MRTFRNILLIAGIFFTSGQASAQAIPESMLCYVDSLGNEVPDSLADFVHVRYAQFSVIETWTMTWKHVSSVTYSDSTFRSKNGQYTFYYADGNTKREEGFYRNDTLTGQWFSWDVHGNLVARGQFNENGRREGQWYYYRPDDDSPRNATRPDSSGVYVNGQPDGEWIFYWDADTVMADHYNQGVLMTRECFWYDGDYESEFTCLPQKAFYYNGAKGLQKLMRNELIYPEAAKTAGIKGIVTVSFEVKEDGSITDIRVENSPHPTIEAEAIRLVGLTDGDWIPAMNHNRPERSRVEMEIRFR